MELSRVEMVIGPKAVEKLNAARVAVIGLGGVGSYVAEALCRTGVSSFVIMDNDTVEASNINRQLPALTSTIGKFKADVMAARLRDINPLCRIRIFTGRAILKIFLWTVLILLPTLSTVRNRKQTF